MDRPAFGKSLNMSSDMIGVGRPNRPGRPIAPTHITIHNTDNTDSGADAQAHASFVTKTGYDVWKGKRRHVSWHYTVDDKRVIKHLPINELAYHAGRGNAVSIAIEICMHAGIDQVAANDRATRLVAVLMYDLAISADKVVTHQHWTKKDCPSLLLDSFGQFVAMATEYRDDIQPSVLKSANAPDEIVTGDERAAIKNAGDKDVESFDPQLLEADNPHPGSFEAATQDGGGDT